MGVELSFNGLPFQEAIDHLENKIQVPTQYWDQILGQAHAKAFTVAGATKADLLADLHTDITEALANGESITDYRKRWDKAIHNHGWSYKGKRGWRTRIVYDTNMRTARAAGRWKQIERTKKRRPYLIYMTVDDNRVRDDHRSWHKLALPVDDPFWNTHYPPNGWGCRCFVITATAAQLKRMGIEIVQHPGILTSERINVESGEIYGDVPIGIDTGWNYNVGKAWLGSDVALGQKIQQLPNFLRSSIQFNNDAQLKSWQGWLAQVKNAENKTGYAHTLGFIDVGLSNALAAKNISPLNAALIASANALNVSDVVMKKLPTLFLNRLATLLHTPSNQIAIALQGQNKKTRVLVNIDFNDQTQSIAKITNVTEIDVGELNGDDYQLLDGKV